ncbi:hypothetical protein GX51_00750 [Blastomyces parvus]|uniref:Uncharacterized protein n=1 Tax=Blastomyces parvus TaxID=2060905 RepID=A0A2B7XL22_9EURO|nr:hypothetical protein GX51_00750 [Blastomyces parvus]
MSPSIFSDSFVVQGSSTHAFQLSQPSEQWKLSLQEVKLLYLRRQYKQCAAKSTKLLRKMDIQLHAIQKAFLHYYSAISYDALGRGAHNYSSNKLPLLNLARDNFTGCKSSIMVALGGSVEKKQHLKPPLQQQWRKPNNNRTREHVLKNDKRKSYPGVSPTKSCREAPRAVEHGTNHHAAASTAPAQQSTSPSQSTMVPRQGPSVNNKELMPSPLRIHKVYQNGYYQDQLIEYDPPSLPPPTRPLPELPPEANHSPVSNIANATTTHDEPHTVTTVSLFRPLAPQFYRHSIGFSPASPLTTSSRRTGRNSTIHKPQANANSIFPLPQNSPLIPLITSLCTQLDANVKSTCTLISRTLELQRVHNAKKNSRLASFWSFTPTYDDENVIANDPFYNHDTDYSNDYSHKAAATTTTSSSNSSYHSNGNSTSPPSSTSSTSSPSSSPPPPPSSSASTDETRQQRIARLKADGWTTVGLRSRKRGWKGSAYYERVCNEALAELYGNGNANTNGSGRVR